VERSITICDASEFDACWQRDRHIADEVASIAERGGKEGRLYHAAQAGAQASKGAIDIAVALPTEVAAGSSVAVDDPTSAIRPTGQDPGARWVPERSQYRSVRGEMPVLSG
jgi:hypothetical protein